MKNITMLSCSFIILTLVSSCNSEQITEIINSPSLTEATMPDMSMSCRDAFVDQRGITQRCYSDTQTGAVTNNESADLYLIKGNCTNYRDKYLNDIYTTPSSYQVTSTYEAKIEDLRWDPNTIQINHESWTNGSSQAVTDFDFGNYALVTISNISDHPDYVHACVEINHSKQFSDSSPDTLYPQ